MSELESGELVFVYGTLRRGGSNAFRMDGAEFVGPATVAGKLYAIIWYPGLVLESGPERVLGELHRVSPEQMLALDEFEGISAHEIEGAEYRRVKTEARMLTLSGDGIFEVWTYEWKGPVEEKQHIPSGDWLDFWSPRSFPWFTWIAVICLLAFPFGAMAASEAGYHRSGFAGFVSMATGIGGLAAPWAALAATYFARRSREKSEPLGCIFSLTVTSCVLSAAMIVSVLAKLFD